MSRVLTMAARTEERIGYFLRERNIKYTQSNCFHMELNVLNVCDNMLDMFPPSHPPHPLQTKDEATRSWQAFGLPKLDQAETREGLAAGLRSALRPKECVQNHEKMLLSGGSSRQ